MTAQIAVLNTQGIALASDSAVTITGSDRPRSYLSADKVFPVLGVPLAVLHSGNATLRSVPWQLLIERWSQTREPVQTPSVEAYAVEFRAWLVEQRSLVTADGEDDFLRWLFRDYLLAVRNQVRCQVEAEGIEPQAGYVDGALERLVDETVDGILQLLEGRDDFGGMSAVDAAQVVSRLWPQLEEDLAWVFDDTPRTGHLDEVARRIALLLVTRAEPFACDAVLVFAGYGQDDWFPSLYQFSVSGVLAPVLQ